LESFLVQHLACHFLASYARAHTLTHTHTNISLSHPPTYFTSIYFQHTHTHTQSHTHSYSQSHTHTNNHTHTLTYTVASFFLVLLSDRRIWRQRSRALKEMPCHHQAFSSAPHNPDPPRRPNQPSHKTKSSLSTFSSFLLSLHFFSLYIFIFYVVLSTFAKYFLVLPLSSLSSCDIFFSFSP